MERSPDEAYRETVLQAVAPLLEFHREVLERMLAILRRNGHAELLSAFLQDPVIASALRGYGLVGGDNSSPPASQPPSVKQTNPGAQKLISVETLLASTKRKWLPLLHEHELKEGEFLRVQVFEDEVLVWMIQGRVLACKNRCPQGGASLAPATSDHTFIVCPCHGYHFNLRSGECTEVPALKLEILPVELQNNVVRVGL